MALQFFGRGRPTGPAEILRRSDAASFDSLTGRAAILDSSGRIVAVNEAWQRLAESTRDWGQASVQRGTNYLSVLKKAAARGDEYAQSILLGATSVVRHTSTWFASDYPAATTGGIKWYRLTAAPLNGSVNGALIVIDAADHKSPDAERQYTDRDLVLLQTIVQTAAHAVGAGAATIWRMGEGDDPECRMVTQTSGLFPPSDESHPHQGSPCADLEPLGFLYRRSGVQREYPQAAWLQRAGANGFADTAIRGHDGRIIGHLSVLHHEGFSDSSSVEGALRLFAARIGPDLERIIARDRDHAETGGQSAGDRDVFESVSDAVIVLDEHGVVTRANSSAATLYGITRAELIGKTTYDLSSNHELMDSLRQEVSTTGRWQGEGKLDRSDGTSIYAEALVTAMDSVEGTRSYVAVVRDMTERKLAEDQAAEAGTKHAALLGSIPDMIFCLDRNGVYLDYQGGAGTHPYVPKEEFLGKTVHDVVPPDVADICMPAIRTSIDTNTTMEIQYSLELPDGVHDYECRLIPINGEWVLCLVRDRTGQAARGADATGAKPADEPRRLRRNAYHLTFRELTVLQLITAGATDKEISQKLFVSVFTVNKHVANILGKMQASSRTEAAVRAAREGLVE